MVGSGERAMSAGYGRGYYGVEQMAPQPPRRRGSGWIPLAVVVGVGAVIWFMWPRSSQVAAGEGGGGGDAPQPPAPPPVPPPEGQSSQGDLPQLNPDQEAQARGYPSRQAYEDAVVASARQLQDAGAKVSFSPHLQHLTPLLGS
jgi:hypothetical protein